ncbi:crystal et79 [Fusarium longipes]|uniref:Crystal et79 n=1 Tax=Fusarium longipes TaxID=694270 RepID=A0A395TAI5_9HYPO|nr:crystal et79 [Fusarium longipes]
MSPARSTFVQIVNNTSLELHLEKSFIIHGEWSSDLSPPSIIGPNDKGQLQAESNGIMTGDEGILYYSSSAGTFQFTFDNPYTGSNSYYDNAPEGYIINREGGGGDNAEVTWTIGEHYHMTRSSSFYSN